MSIKDLHSSQSKAQISEQKAESPGQDNAQKRIAWYKRRPGKRTGSLVQKPSYLPLLFCLLIACVVRVFIVIHTQSFIDGDEALVGIQAEHILHGEFPIYFYNQPYMGSLEAYLMASIFAIVGPSVWALRAEPILLSLVIVWLTWKLASALADTAQLPFHAKKWFMIIAAFLAAIPPLYDTVLQLHTLGGYVEIFIFMLLLMLFALKLTNRRATGASMRELAWIWACIGCIVGLGLWINPLIIYGIFAAAIWILWDWIKALKAANTLSLNEGEQRNTGIFDENADRNIVGAGLAPARSSPTQLAQAHPAHTQLSSAQLSPSRFALTLATLRKLFLPALASIPACIVGLTPAIYWGALNHWQNITYILNLSGNPQLRPEVQTQYPTRVDIFFGLAHLYTACVGPRIISGALPAENTGLGYLYIPTFIFSGLCIVATLALVALSFEKPYPLLIKVRKLTALPIVFVGSVSIIYCFTETAASGLWSCDYDFAGRYATPLMLVIPFFIAAIFTSVILFEAHTYNANMAPGVGGALAGSRQENTIEPALEKQTSTSSHASSHAKHGIRYQKIALALMGVLLISSVYLQVVYYALSDAGSTFQSAFCTRAPVNNDAIIAYMQREHIHYAWANNWIAYPIDFKTHESIIVSDPLPIIRNQPILDRIPAYTNAVRKAVRPSFLVLVDQEDSYPLLLHLLDAENVKYRIARFPAHEIKDLLVITPLNKTVSPIDGLNSFFLNVFYCSRQA